MMDSQATHLSDQDLLLHLDGELPVSDQARVNTHLAACWTCRTRRHSLESAIDDFVQLHRHGLDAQIPPPAGRRALLRAQMHHLAPPPKLFWLTNRASLTWRLLASAFAVIASLAAFAYFNSHPPGHPAVTTPDPRLTPGATVLLSRQEVCRQSGASNKVVSRTLHHQVFAEYGIPSAEPNGYEVDYLITPALGGADDIRNLWPQSKAGTVWNSQVKDGLEDHLRALVCDGQLDLPTAQRELATNWIGAYKKYFHTDQPISTENGLR